MREEITYIYRSDGSVVARSCYRFERVVYYIIFGLSCAFQLWRGRRNKKC